MTDNPSISARTIDALTAIATGLHDIADAVRETGRAGEGRIATETGPGAPHSASGDSRTLGERLRALVAGPHPDVLLVRAAEGEWLGIVAEVERLEEKRARQAQTIAEMQEMRERLGMVRELAGAIRETSHCSHLATDIETLLDTPLSELRALKDAP